VKRYRSVDPARSGGNADVLSREEAEMMARQGRWPKPADWDPG
jgi:hypothetical protein